MDVNGESIEKLKRLLAAREDLKEALEASLQKAAQAGIESLPQFYDFARKMLTYIPTTREVDPAEKLFYYLISESADDALKKDPDFIHWVNEFTVELGTFMDSTESAKNLDQFINDPSYKIQEYYRDPSGWLTFNQFLARHVKSGLRPIANPCSDKIVVSTTDSVYLGQWQVQDAKVVTKGTKYSVIDLMAGSAYQDKFKEGVFTHSYLNVTDYHHFHVPVGGKIREIRKIPGRTLLDVVKRDDGSLQDFDGEGYQFTQTRGLVIIESEIGFVAVLAVGMGHISSVNITIDEGVTLAKGDEFGYFSFGGSDMILLFEQGKVEFTAEANKHYKMGEEIARAVQ